MAAPSIYDVLMNPNSSAQMPVSQAPSILGFLASLAAKGQQGNGPGGTPPIARGSVPMGPAIGGNALPAPPGSLPNPVQASLDNQEASGQGSTTDAGMENMMAERQAMQQPAAPGGAPAAPGTRPGPGTYGPPQAPQRETLRQAVGKMPGWAKVMLALGSLGNPRGGASYLEGMNQELGQQFDDKEKQYQTQMTSYLAQARLHHLNLAAQQTFTKNLSALTPTAQEQEIQGMSDDQLGAYNLDRSQFYDADGKFVPLQQEADATKQTIDAANNTTKTNIDTANNTTKATIATGNQDTRVKVADINQSGANYRAGLQKQYHDQLVDLGKGRLDLDTTYKTALIGLGQARIAQGNERLTIDEQAQQTRDGRLALDRWYDQVKASHGNDSLKTLNTLTQIGSRAQADMARQDHILTMLSNPANAIGMKGKQVPVIGPDGKPQVGPDGKPVMQDQITAMQNEAQAQKQQDLQLLGYVDNKAYMLKNPNAQPVPPPSGQRGGAVGPLPPLPAFAPDASQVRPLPPGSQPQAQAGKVNPNAKAAARALLGL